MPHQPAPATVPLFPVQGGSAELYAGLPDASTTVLPTPCTFFPCKTFGGHEQRPSNTVRASIEARPAPSIPSMPHLNRRGVLRTSTAITTPLTGATGQGRAPGMGGRIRKDDDHDLCHAQSARRQGRPTVLPRTTGGEVDDLTDPHACNPTSLRL